MTPRISTLAVIIILGGISLIVWSCVDVGTTNITTQDYHSLARFYDVAVDTTGSIALKVDGTSLGNLSLGQKIDYTSINAGARTLSFAGISQVVSFNTDDQVTILIHPAIKGKRFFYAGEGDSKKNNYTNRTKPGVRFINLAQGNPLSFREGSANGAVVEGSVAYESSTGYDSLSRGAHTFLVVATGDYVATINGTQDGDTTNSRGSGTFELSLADGVVYSITDTIDNSQGFYTAAHFHEGAAGVSGPVKYPIDVTGQTISFPNVTLAPADTSVHSSGATSSVFLNANAARSSDTLNYSISVSGDTADPFLSGDFDRAGGTIVVQPIFTQPETTFALSGQWALSGAMFDSLLKGRIYIVLRTATHPTGSLRARLVPDPFTVNTFTGQWNDGTLVDSIKQDFVAGHIYVNFHTAANPAGQIRGQVLVDPDKGHYGVALLPLDSTYLAGHQYTIVGVGTGSTLRLFKLTDRQIGVTKSAVGHEQPASPPGNATKGSRK